MFDQTLQDIEFIFIDDCSPDKSIDIVNTVLADYPQRKNQVQIHKMPCNSGQAAVREWGIKHSHGEFIANCDSDDWIEHDMYEQMYNSAVSNSSDVVICNYIVQTKEKAVKHKAYIDNITQHELIFKLCSQQVPYCLWNKIFRRSLFVESDIIYPSKSHGEDMALCLQIFCRSGIRISYVDKPLYIYRADSNTLYHIEDESTILKKFEATTENVKIIDDYYSTHNLQPCYASAIMYLKMTSRDKLISLVFKEEYYNIWINTFPEINNRIWFNKSILLKHKIKYFLAKHRLYTFSK